MTPPLAPPPRDCVRMRWDFLARKPFKTSCLVTGGPARPLRHVCQFGAGDSRPQRHVLRDFRSKFHLNGTWNTCTNWIFALLRLKGTIRHPKCPLLNSMLGICHQPHVSARMGIWLTSHSDETLTGLLQDYVFLTYSRPVVVILESTLILGAALYSTVGIVIFLIPSEVPKSMMLKSPA